MNDIRRSILWVVFGFSMVLLWDQWQVYNGHKATFFPSPTPAASAPAAAGSKPADNSVPAASATASAPAANPAAVPENAPAAPRTQHQVSTDVLKLVIDSQGAAIVRAELPQHAAQTPPPKNQAVDPLVLLETEKSYAAQSGLVGAQLPNHTTPMTLTSPATTLADGQDRLELRFESPVLNGVKLVKTYTLQRGAYDIAVRHEVLNQGSTPIKPQLYLQLVRDGSIAGSATPFYSTFTGPVVYSSTAKYQKVEFADIDKGKASFEKSTNDGYVAMVQHYFASAWLLADGARDNYIDRVTVNQNARYRAGAITQLDEIAPGQAKAFDARLFLGPQDEKLLERMAPGLELVKDYGWLTILAKPLYWLLEKIHGFVSNWGWSIVLLVVLIKAAFYWLNATAYRSMAKMKAINPRIMEMRERLKSNPQQMQQEMMKIYREEKVNPLGGCFPIMIQIPVFIALYWVLLSSVEMRNAPWLGWITDLSTPDPYFILPAVMTLTTLLQTALNPTPPDPMQAKLMWFMPLIFSVMFFFFPAGLVMYWITNNVLSIAQQWVINTRMGVPPQFNLPRFK